MKYLTHYNQTDTALLYIPVRAIKTLQQFHAVWKSLEAASLFYLTKSGKQHDLGIIT